MLRHSNTLDPKKTVLLVVDVQERFRSLIAEFESMVKGCVKLVCTFRLLDLPILVTEQYPKGLGSTVPELKAALEVKGSTPRASVASSESSGEPLVLEKSTFSSYGCEALPSKLEVTGARSVLVCGIEAQVCVNQSVHDLLSAGYSVQVAVDAVQSRHLLDRDIALRKMEQSGAVLTTAEMAAFELLRDAKHPRFKEVQALFK